jgi:phage shock protein A
MRSRASTSSSAGSTTPKGRADALSIADGTGKPSLADEIAALEGADKIDEELEEMKRALGMGDEAEKKGE